MKDLASASPKEIEDFFNSFDLILSDVDGVVWLPWAQFEGIKEGIDAMKRTGKRIVFVSNNATKPYKFYCSQLKSAGFIDNDDDLVVPTLAMITYLRSINFDKEIYLIGNTHIRRELENAGFKITEPCPDRMEETAEAFIKAVVVPNPNIGAIIADMDINVNYIKLQRAASYLNNPDVLFLTGGGDVRLPFKNNLTLLGPGVFHQILKDSSGREPISMAKPNKHLHDYIKKKYNITDPSRVLFIGDSIPEDMGFAAACGYKKLMVLSGLCKKSMLENWEWPEEFKPDFYVEGIRKMPEILGKTRL